MNDNKRALCLVFAFSFCLCLPAIMATEAPKDDFSVLTSGKYQVQYDSGVTNPENIAMMLNDYFSAFSDLCHFDKNGPGFSYAVKVFSSPEKFNSYITGKTGNETARGTSSFLKYTRPEKSEVVFIAGTPTTDIARQLAMQYLYSYVKNPPAWLLGGFSLNAENMAWDVNTGIHPAKMVHPWLDTVKQLRDDSAKTLTAKQIMTAEKSLYATDVLYPQAWLLLDFLMNTFDPSLARMMPESITALRLKSAGPYVATLENENTALFTAYVDTWSSWAILENLFSKYAAENKSVRELLNEGIAFYVNNDMIRATERFEKVLSYEENNSTADYYIGLMAYSQGKYADAEKWYKKALENGADAALINWALGASAYSERRFTEAEVYLKTAASLSPETYGQRVEELLSTIPQKP